MISRDQTPRRQRGVILTEFGRQRFQAARHRLKTDTLNGGRFSLERLSLDVGLSTKTISRVLTREMPVDIRSLEVLFAALKINLEPGDFSRAPHAFTLQHGLPERRSTFFGRTAEIARVHDLLAQRRIVTLTGAGGVGKTRLALEAVACDPGDSFGRATYCDLSLVTDPTLVVAAISAAVPKSADQHARMLLLVDNCEHVREHVARAIDDLLGKIKFLVVLATSREALGVEGEAVVRIMPFTIPVNAGRLRVADALRGDAVALFVDRARCADDRFHFDDDAVAHTVEIVSHLQGLPLAIEITASRVATTELAEIADSLRDRRRALVSESAAHPSRHRSLCATIDASFALLDQRERRIFRRLAVFGDGFEASAARAVVADGSIEVTGAIGRLVRKCLLSVQSGTVPTHYRMLEAVREYAALKLDEHGEAPQTRLYHAVHLHDWLTTADANAIARNLATIHEVLEWSSVHSHNRHIAAAICRHLVDFWDLRGDYAQGAMWLHRALECNAELAPATTRARLHEGLALLVLRQGLLGAARHHATSARYLYGDANDALGSLRASAVHAMAAFDADDLETAHHELVQNVCDAERLGSAPEFIVALENLGRLQSEYHRDYQASLDLFARCLTKARSAGMTSMVATVLADIADVWAKLGSYSEAVEFAHRGLLVAKDVGNVVMCAGLALREATYRIKSSGVAAARAEIYLARETIGPLLVNVKLSYGLDAFAEALSDAGRVAEAATLLGSIATMRDGLRSEYARLEARSGEIGARICAKIGASLYQSLYLRGSTLALDEALRLATLVFEQ